MVCQGAKQYVYAITQDIDPIVDLLPPSIGRDTSVIALFDNFLFEE